MKRTYLVIFTLSICACLAVSGIVAARSELKGDDSSSDVQLINKVIDDFQEAYSNKQADKLRTLFCSEAVIGYDQNEGREQGVISIDEWIQYTKENTFRLHEKISDRLTNREITVFRNIAYAVCDYTYTDYKVTYKGIDVITFMKIKNRWRIVSLQWTGEQVK